MCPRPIRYGEHNPVAVRPRRRGSVVCSYGEHVHVMADGDLIDAVHVQRDSAFRAPPTTHAPSTAVVNGGVLLSVENADHAVSSCDGVFRSPSRASGFAASIGGHATTQSASPVSASRRRRANADSVDNGSPRRAARRPRTTLTPDLKCRSLGGH
jgi:hypothetical protein